jgi:hypothetical protein
MVPVSLSFGSLFFRKEQKRIINLWKKLQIKIPLTSKIDISNDQKRRIDPTGG